MAQLLLYCKIQQHRQYSRLQQYYSSIPGIHPCRHICRDTRQARRGGLTGEAKQGKASEGKARKGEAIQGRGRQGNAKQGKTRQGKARKGKVRPEKARKSDGRHGNARGKARQGKARQGKARQGKSRQGKARQGKARQGKARQGKARQSSCSISMNPPRQSTKKSPHHRARVGGSGETAASADARVDQQRPPSKSSGSFEEFGPGQLDPSDLPPPSETYLFHDTSIVECIIKS